MNKVIQAQNPYFDDLIYPCFQGIDRPLELLFENNAHKKRRKRYFLPT